jgi:hypothetical protein
MFRSQRTIVPSFAFQVLLKLAYRFIYNALHVDIFVTAYFTTAVILMVTLVNQRPLCMQAVTRQLMG